MIFKKVMLPVAVLAASLSTTVQASGDTHDGPDFGGKLNIGVLQAGSRDYDVWAFKADLGVSGLYSTESGITFKYEFVADFAGELNGPDEYNETWTSGETSDLDNGNASESDIDVHTARVFVITDYGLLLIAPRTISGQWAQLYGAVDKFEYNRMHGKTGPNAIFAQIEQANDVLAYVSPEFAGGARLILAGLTIADRNEEDLDAKVWRLVYDNKQGLKAGVGVVNVSDKLVPETYNRTAATLSYDFESFSIGGSYEINDKHPTGDFESYAVVAETAVSERVTATVGYANKDHDDDTLDNSGLMAKLSYKTGDKSYLFLEGGQYDETVNNVLAGVSLSF